MLPLPSSSGDLLADRRLAWAEACADDGDPAAAAALLADTLAATPGWTAGWVRLGEFREAAGDAAAAAAAYETALRTDPGDRFGAQVRLDLLRRVPLTEGMPVAFVETLFDQYAPGFDAALVGALNYRAPDLLLAALHRDGPRRFARALDLGCGTGLFGQALRPHADRIEGCDLSEGMLREAAAKAVYDLLEKRDLQTLVAPAAPEYDLVAAADVFIYVGALEAVTAWAAAALLPGGSFAFTVEAAEGEGIVLGPARRYAHSESYLRALLARAGFTGIAVEHAALRHDRGRPVAGLIVTACRPGIRQVRAGEALATAG